MDIFGIIPARGGSKRLPDKNILPLAGKPMIAWTIEAALKSRLLTKVCVSTDDANIAAVARQSGALVVDRPAELATDDAPIEAALRHAVKTLGGKPEIIVWLHANV
ncbi:MAG: acylneuraminate cytidylyltransferase family protein, partial [Candidatus Aenigmatarchaeota archaeon]